MISGVELTSLLFAVVAVFLCNFLYMIQVFASFEPLDDLVLAVSTEHAVFNK